MNVFYVAHPFLGKKKNVRAVEKIIKDLIYIYPDTVFYSPLHATGFYYHNKTKEDGMRDCFELLSRCDELWLTGDYEKSEGCMKEIAWAQEHDMPIRVVFQDTHKNRKKHKKWIDQARKAGEEVI